eukprot:scaffold22653_cov53-Attheya_sp.AAC.1
MPIAYNIHYKASYGSPPTMDSLPPMPTPNTTSDTVVCLEVPQPPTLPPPSLSLLHTWPEH